jgi:hypothetical protein
MICPLPHLTTVFLLTPDPPPPHYQLYICMYTTVHTFTLRHHLASTQRIKVVCTYGVICLQIQFSKQHISLFFPKGFIFFFFGGGGIDKIEINIDLSMYKEVYTEVSLLLTY